MPARSRAASEGRWSGLPWPGPRCRARRYLPALLALALYGHALAEVRLETHVLQAETAERLLPIIEPLLPEGAAITGRSGHLFVRGDDQTQAEVRRLLEDLDRPPQRLLVQLRDRMLAGAWAGGVDGRTRLEAGQAGTALDGGVRIHGTTDLRRATGTDSIHVLAGAPALIGSGTALVVPLQALLPLPGGVLGVQAGVDWIEAGRETWLLARTTRDGGVIVKLAASREALLPGGAGLAGSGLTTTLTGPLGSWFEVGGSRTVEGSEGRAARVFGTQKLRARAEGLEMRVDVLP